MNFFFTTDADYEAFLQTLNKEVEPLPSAEAHLEEIEARKEGNLADFSIAFQLIPYFAAIHVS